MSKLWGKHLALCGIQFSRFISCERAQIKTVQKHNCKLLIVGGGAGGCSVAWRFADKLNDGVIVLEPSDKHFYQPLFTLIGAGIRPFSESVRPISSVLPPCATWVRDSAARLDPVNCRVITLNHEINYQYMVVAVGLINYYDQIPGLRSALDDPLSGVSTIYSADYCNKTWCDLQRMHAGHFIFTFPKQGVKCSGAAQKIMYLADDYFRKHKRRKCINITYNTGNEHIFGVPKYAATLTKICKERAMSVNYCMELVGVRNKEALFHCGDGCPVNLPFNFLHVTPPMRTPSCLHACPALVDPAGYVDVDHSTLQHKRFCNVFALGDCTTTPNSKTAAAVACQSKVVEHNLISVMDGREPVASYNGYGACPILTSYGKSIIAEFDYKKTPIETFPFDQSKESRLLYYMNVHMFPYIYWNKLIKGRWNGPARLRRIINPLKR